MKQLLKRMGQWLPYGLQQAGKTIAYEMLFSMQHRRGAWQAKKYPFQQYNRLHLGCGPQIKQGWLNIDLDTRADITLDLRRPLPLPDNHFDLIYSEHFLEHIAYPEPVTSLVKECYRMLKVGGTFSVVVPDIVLVMRSYFEGAPPEYYQAQQTFHPHWCHTQMEHINYNFRQSGEHQFCYDMETMTKLLTSAGFINIQRRKFDETLDNPERIVGSMYVQCQK